MRSDQTTTNLHLKALKSACVTNGQERTIHGRSCCLIIRHALIWVRDQGAMCKIKLQIAGTSKAYYGMFPACLWVCYLRLRSFCLSWLSTDPIISYGSHVKTCVIRVTHLRGEDIVGHIHHPVVVVTEALHFSHHRGLDSSVGRLISFLVDEDPSAEQKDTTQKVKEPLKGSNSSRLVRISIFG